MLRDAARGDDAHFVFRTFAAEQETYGKEGLCHGKSLN
jgi:hypothetical protein